MTHHDLPGLLAALALLALLPWRGRRWARPLFLAALAVGLLWLFHRLRVLFAPFVVAFALAYLLNPIVGVLERAPLLPGGRRRLGRTAAIVLLLLPLGGAVALLAVWLVPRAARQAVTLADELPVWGTLLAARAQEWIARLPGGGNVEIDADRVKEALRHVGSVLAGLGKGAAGVGRGIGAALSFLSYVILTPVLTFYLVRDYERVLRWGLEWIPESRRAVWTERTREVDRILSGYFRGQVTVSLVVGALTGTGLFVLGAPFPLLVGLLVAALNLIPYVGLYVSLGVALLASFLAGDLPADPLKVIAVFAAVQTLDGAVLSPRIVGSSVGLHPVGLLFAMLLAGQIFGFVGLILAVPGAAILYVAVKEAHARALAGGAVTST